MEANPLSQPLCSQWWTMSYYAAHCGVLCLVVPTRPFFNRKPGTGVVTQVHPM